MVFLLNLLGLLKSRYCYRPASEAIFHHEYGIPIGVVQPKLIRIPRRICFKPVRGNNAPLDVLFKQWPDIFHINPDHRTAQQGIAVGTGVPLQVNHQFSPV